MGGILENTRGPAPGSSWICSVAAASADVPFCFTAIFGASSSAVCAALWDGRWGPRLQSRPLALRDGGVFHFKEVVANGNRLLEFRYRRPRRIADTLKVTGHASVRVIGFVNEDPYHPLQTR
ncbi:galectin-12-like [Hypanus sabinus]|uniref:galectin-12-like n=1 Tax=Hypanus sabinus TaxID=79690 RepID=UPI0028C39317|nr:galectin-12-like [Hypanus sabinus]